MDDDIKDKEDITNKTANRAFGPNRRWGGLILIIAGAFLLARKLGAHVPDWIFSWPMILIAIGLLIGFRSNFRNAGGYIMILVGCAFLISNIIPNIHARDFIWPCILIIIGMIFILKPRAPFTYKRKRERWDDYSAKTYHQPETTFEVNDTSEFVEINAVFGGVKKLILSKNFRGGEINTFMGGAEINLQQADIKQPVSLEVNNVFGGTKIILPSNWDIKNEITAVFGGVEDKRSMNLPTPDFSKSIILSGTCVFGGIEIRNF